jgi:hypothetical protein
MKIRNSVFTLALSTLAMTATLAPSSADALTLEYETEIVSMDLSGTFPLPLADDWLSVLSEMRLSESLALMSTGQAKATYTGVGSNPATPADIQDGDEFFVDSFFDVFFDIEIEDVDPGADFGGGLGQLLGPFSSGPAHMSLGGADGTTQNIRIADTSKPNFGLFPIDGDVYLGHVEVDIPLPVSLGGDPLEDDRLKFQFATHSVDNVSAQFLVLGDGTVVEEFDSTAPLSGGIDDASQDPPFGPFDLTGPTRVHSLGPQPAGVPEPSTVTLLLLGAAIGFGSYRRRRS